MGFLVVREPGRVAYAVALGASTSVGRGSDNDIVLADPQVSRAHLRIAAGTGGLIASDLASRHGSFVNGARIEEQALRDGDVLQLGNVLITYRDGAPQDAPVIESVPPVDATLPLPARAEGGRLLLLHAVAALIDGGGGGAPVELAGRMLEHAVAGLGGDAGVVGLLDGRGGMRRIARGAETVLARAVVDAMVARRESVLVSEGGRHGVGAPLSAAGRARGFAYVARSGARFDAADRSFLDVAAHLTAAALARSDREGRLVRAAEALREAAPALVGESDVMVALRARIERFAAAPDTAVLIRGESGTGKELIARQLHSRSPRADGPFVAVNCAAIPDSLIESELFGHEKGAFTGAVRAQRGRFALAHGGTLFLDEVGDLSAAAQAKLLRAIEELEVKPVGAEEPIEVDVRVVSATHKSLEDEIAAGRFRSDLYYRLAVAELQAPPLRARGSDILLLATSFLERFARRLDHPARGFTPEARALLERYPWPGNVRQLSNEIERALLLSDGELVDLGDLGERIGPGAAPASHNLADAERDVVQRALADAGGNIRGAARALGVSRNTLYRKLVKYNLVR